jgi:peptidoglycan/LPS O-acetylase OafA/YrhL
VSLLKQIPGPRKKVDWALLGLLRFLMAFVVLCVHGAWFLPGRPPVVDQVKQLGGKSAVIAFLILSGFSIGASVGRAEPGFYVRRLLRIYPSYLVAVALTVLVQHLTGGVLVVPNHVFHASGMVVVLGNLVFLQTIAVSAIGFNYSLWSLAVEVIYYAVAPVLHRGRTIALVGALVISAILFLLPTREDRGLVYLALTKLKILKYFWSWGLGFLLWRNHRPLLLFVGAATSLILVSLSAETSEAGSWVPLAMTFAALHLATNLTSGPRLTRIFNYLGDCSYPLYLLHLPTLILGAAVGLRGPSLFVPVLAITMLDTFAIEHRVRPWLTPLLIRRPGPIGPSGVNPAGAGRAP